MKLLSLLCINIVKHFLATSYDPSIVMPSDFVRSATQPIKLLPAYFCSVKIVKTRKRGELGEKRQKEHSFELETDLLILSY
jgi:hypothetical protein